MATGYLFRFGTYSFPRTFRPSDDSFQYDTAPQARPRAAGATTQIGRREPTILTLRGELGGSGVSFDQLTTLETELKCALGSGKQNLYFGRDDRYYRDAQVKSVSNSSMEGQTFGVISFWSISFEAADFPEPFATDGTETDLFANGGTVTNTGSADALPAWTITIGSTGTGPLTLTNAATGESATIGDANTTLTSGDVIVLDRDGYAVTNNDAAQFGLFDGRIPRLLTGDNDITLTAGGTATASALSVAYTPRFG